MCPDFLHTPVAEMVDSVLQDDDEFLVVDPTYEMLVELISVISTRTESIRAVRILASTANVKAFSNNFIAASQAKDLIEMDRLHLRHAEDVGNSLLLSPHCVLSVVNTGQSVSALSTAQEEFVDAAYDTYSSVWEEATEYNLHAPALSEVLESLESLLGEDAPNEFMAMMQALPEADSSRPIIDEVGVSLLLGAKYDTLLYDLSKWGENVGLASKATFSRTKTHLEDHGLIETEKVPIDVGRPRLRLTLASEELERASPEALVTQARSALT